MSWPTNHPGRTCAKCGRNVYWLWCDPIYPPPGVCMDQASHPRRCEDFRSHCITHLQIARGLDRSPHPTFMATLERAGVTLEEAVVWLDDFQAKNDAEDAEFMASLSPTPQAQE